MTLKEWVNKDFLNFFNVIKRRFADKTEVDALSQEIYKELEKYVQKVEGKGLSANDFTDELKKKLEDLMDREELDAALKAVNDLIENLESGGVEGIIDTLNEIKEFLSGYNEGDNLLQIIKETIEEITNNYTELVENTKTEINNTIESTKTEINETIDSTREDLEQKIKEGDDKLDAKIDETKTTLEGELNTAKEELDNKIDSTKSELEGTISSTNQETRNWADEKFVTELGTREDFITWTRDGEVHDLTVPFATHSTNADHATTADSAGNVNWSDVESHPTTLEGYGITDGFNKVSVVGEGNAITTGSGEGHTITLTKGDTFVLKSELGTSVPTLVDGKIPESQLPGYVDDVLEFDSKEKFPTQGESGKIYVSTNDNITYRWAGTTYVEISKSLALGENASTAFAGDRGKKLEDALGAFTASISGKTITITINGRSQTIQLPTVAYSDVTGIPSTLPNPHVLTFGSKTYDGSSAQSITAADLGVSTTTEADAKYVKKAGDTMTGTLINTTTSGLAIQINKPTNGAGFIRFKNTDTDRWDIRQSNDATTHLGIAYNANADLISVLSNGNVGIGNSTPDAKLHVMGNIYAHTNITALSGFRVSGMYGYSWNTGEGAYEVTIQDNDQQIPLLLAHRAAGNTASNRLFAMELLNKTGELRFGFGGTSKYTFLPSGELTAANKVTATGFKIPSGTSSQFLKADGSVDSNTYLTTSNASSTYVTKTDAGKYVTTDTAQTVSGVKTFSSTQSFTNTTKPFSVTSTALVNNLNADLLDGYHKESFMGYYKYVIDTRNLDQNTWYPVTMQLPTTTDRVKIRINGQNLTNASWAQDNRTAWWCDYEWDVCGDGWGALDAFRVIYSSRYKWVIGSAPVAGIGQLTHTSEEYVFVRGGSTYTFYLSRNIMPKLRTETYTSTSSEPQSVSPTTTPPANIVRNNVLTEDLSSYVTLNTAQTITGKKTFNGDSSGLVFTNGSMPTVTTASSIVALDSNQLKQITTANLVTVLQGAGVYTNKSFTIGDYQKKVPIVQQGSTTSLTAAWDTKYVFSAAVTGTLNITFATKPSDTYDHYIIIIFKAGASKPTITFPNTVKFGETLSVEANETVEINITLGNSTVGEYLGLWKAYKG